MGILEEIEEALLYLWEIFSKNWWRIISLSAILFFIIPFIKWALFGTLYFIFKTEYLLQKFTEVTFLDSFLPWWLEALMHPLGAIVDYLLIVLIITCIFCLVDYYST